MDWSKIDRKVALIAVIFGIISVLILSVLKVQGVIAVLMLWLLAPVLIKKFLDKLRDTTQ